MCLQQQETDPYLSCGGFGILPTWQEYVTVPVYLRSDQGPVSEPCLLVTNVVIPLGLMVPGPGVRVKSSGMGWGGVVRLSIYQPLWCMCRGNC